MTDDEIQDIADRVIESLNNLTPGEPEIWEIVVAFAPFSALIAAGLVTWAAWRTLRQRRESDNRSEWWKRTQWALDATASKDPKMVAYGRGLLRLLVESTMASADDKAVLDAIWVKSETTMDYDGIQQLTREIEEAGNLTDDEQSSIRDIVDDSRPLEDNGQKEER